MSAISSIASSIPTPGTPGSSGTSTGSIRRSGDTTGATTPNIKTGEPNPFAEVSSEEWLGIILEELSNQDPFEPNDTSATLEQLNSLRSIESDLSLQEQLESLVLQNSIGQAGSLIGKEVEGLGTNGLNVTGIVASVRVVEGKSQLQLQNGSTVTFGNVTNVANPNPQATAANAAATTAVPAAAPAGGVPTNGNSPEVDALTAALSGLADTLNASAASTK